MTNYTWTITDLFTKTIDGKEGYVVNAVYDVLGTDGTHSASLEAGSVQFSTEDVG
jgi:hypothetical protein